MGDVRMILEFFHSHVPQLQLTRESLDNPQTDQLIQAYNYLCGLVLENMNCEMADNNVDQVLARPNLVIKTRESVNLVFESIFNGNDEFCYTDLLQPDPRRTRHFLVTLIRFYCFKCEMSTEVMNIENELEAQCRTYKLEKDFASKTEADINNEKKRLNALEEEKHLIESQDLKTQQELMTKRALIATEKKKCEEVQKRLKELEAEIETYKEKGIQIEDTLKRLDLNIVTSPELLIEELKKLEKHRLDVEKKLEDTQKTKRKTEYEVAEILAMGQRIDALGEDLEKLEEFKRRMPEMRGNEDKIIQEVNNLEKEKNEMRNKLEHINKGAVEERTNIKEKILATRIEVETINQKIKNLQSDEKELSNRLFKIKENIRENMSKNEEMDRKFVLTTERFDEIIRSRLNDLKMLKKKTDDQQSVLDKILKRMMN
uniref:Kinetochore protein Nuf2 N-terminal domain-containing protein n=1 Tax=Meloidogyne enterolobii TaxID=390850 RepID=A0A6V7TNV0_MELEN|nr:unnamed protein product [Meloidogyne enterolobii]